MLYDTSAANHPGDVVTEYISDISDRVVKVFPVYIPKDSTEKSNILDSSQDHSNPPHSLYISKLGEQSSTFSSKPSNHPPVFQPEYLEHSPVFYYTQDTIGVSDVHDDLFHIQTRNDEDLNEDMDINNNGSDTGILSVRTNNNNDSEFLSTNSVSGDEIEYDTDVSDIPSCSPQSCLSQPDQACCSPHTTRKRQTEFLQHLLDVDRDAPQEANGHDRVTATITRTMKSVSW